MDLQAFNRTIDFEQRINTLISWFTHPKTPINFGMLYIEEPDYHGHAIGINNDDFNDILKKLDNLTKYLHDQLKLHNLNDVNVIHLSDHGMADITYDRIINITDVIDPSEYKSAGLSPAMHFFPETGKMEILHHFIFSATYRAKTNALNVLLAYLLLTTYLQNNCLKFVSTDFCQSSNVQKHKMLLII